MLQGDVALMEVHLGGQIARLARGRSCGGQGIGISGAIEIGAKRLFCLLCA
jgi:hypothetical protein